MYRYATGSNIAPIKLYRHTGTPRMLPYVPGLPNSASNPTQTVAVFRLTWQSLCGKRMGEQPGVVWLDSRAFPTAPQDRPSA